MTSIYLIHKKNQTKITNQIRRQNLASYTEVKYLEYYEMLLTIKFFTVY
ncbi:hypothetical protein HMPREF9372_1103 [Sporosarcina newyorkensis 2681]|uniref:Uncharacterized protein n=1 Tax=Sporosarcina newyorkensis 2681 TaxID=1027292 RepID=F9DQL4_9BACL|nr:hypothetical protein HMPREF9372_1103 [Sporosarcina newyorkensis 2681]